MLRFVASTCLTSERQPASFIVYQEWEIYNQHGEHCDRIEIWRTCSRVDHLCGIVWSSSSGRLEVALGTAEAKKLLLSMCMCEVNKGEECYNALGDEFSLICYSITYRVADIVNFD